MAATKETAVEIQLVTGVRQMPVFALGTGGLVQQAFVFTDTQPGLDQLDRITAVNGVNVTNENQLVQELQKCMRGQECKLTVARRPQAAPAPATMVKSEITLDKQPTDASWGLLVSANRAGTALCVTGITDAAARTQLQMGDHLTALNGKPVNSVPSFRAALATVTGNQLKLTVERRTEPKASSAPAPVSAAAPASAHNATVRLQYDEGEVIGVFLENLKVVRIQPGSIAEDSFVLGDQIKQINGFTVTKDDEVHQKLARAKGPVTILVERIGPEPDAEKRHTPTPTAPEGPPTSSDDHVAVSLKVNLPPGQALGVTPNEHCKAVKVQEKSIAEEHFKLGDVIKSVNGEPVGSEDAFSKLIEKHRPNLTIMVDRSKFREAEVELRQLPENIERMIQRHAGHDYLIKDVKFDPKRPFGLALANCAHNRVIVTTAAPGSTAADNFRAYDRLLLINGSPVTDQTVAKEYICAAAGAFQAVVERPRTVETWGAVKAMYEAWRKQAAVRDRQITVKTKEDDLPADAMLIADQQRKRIAAKQIVAAKTVLKKTPSNPKPSDKKLSFGAQAVVVQIQSDVPIGKALRKL